ncbi:ATP-binding protein [Rugosimonospora africana]|uniref:ATP-binding protein n=1 Tax=Rugosimonospora africana TaxID=556532 RepID=UPI001941230B|nr:tetratricopeptide repeat protein [Rugosimonospora africana]
MLPAEVRPALTGLPPASTVFSGRDHAVTTLQEALRPGQQGGVQLVSAVAGMAGVGKTELVLHIAHRVLAEGWFPGGVLFVDMFGYDPDRQMSASDALAGWLSAIGISGEYIPASQQDRSRLWRSVLDAYTAQDRRLLLIIDNVAGEDQVRPLLPGDARLPVLVTSRHTLDLDARLHDLEVLDPDAALTLIREVLASRRGVGDPRLAQGARDGLAALADVCGGLPLALRIVAALLADRPHLQPDVLAGRLRNDQHRLDGLTRQQAAVRAAFDLSYQHLSDAQSRLFRLLPVNPGPDIATAAAACLADLTEQQTAGLLADLHRAHLITEPAAERWAMHDLLRLYATDQQSGDNSGENTETVQARRRLYSYYQDTTRTANTHLVPTGLADTSQFIDRAHALAWLDAEHTNLIATAITAPDQHMAEVAVDLAFALPYFLDFRRHFTDWITITAHARDIFQQTGDRHGEGRAWNNLGFALQKVRRFEESIQANTQARNLYQEAGDRHGEGRAWNNLGVALREVGRFEESIQAHTQARDLFHQAGDWHGKGQASNSLGVALQQVGRFEESIQAHTQARDIMQQNGDRRAEGRAWNNLGLALAEVGRFSEAIDAHAHDLEICQQIGDRHGEGEAWINLGAALHQTDRLDEAIEAHTRARDILQESGDRHGEGKAWFNLGVALREVGRFDAARASGQQAITAFVEAGDASLARFVHGWLDDLPDGGS